MWELFSLSQVLYVVRENKRIRENPKLPHLFTELLQLIGPCIVKPELFLLLMSSLTHDFCPSISNCVSALPHTDIFIAVVGTDAMSHSLGGIRYCFDLCMFRFSQSELLRAKTLQGFRIEKHSKRWNCFQRYIKPVAGTLRGLRSLLLSVLRKGKLRCCNLLMAMQGASSKAQTRTCFLISVSFASNPPSPQPKGDTNIQCWDIGCCWKHLHRHCVLGFQVWCHWFSVLRCYQSWQCHWERCFCSLSFIPDWGGKKVGKSCHSAALRSKTLAFVPLLGMKHVSLLLVFPLMLQPACWERIKPHVRCLT